MSTMVERAEIPEHIWDAARALRNAVLWESNSSVEHIAQALLAAEKRGKEEAAKIAEGNSAEFDFGKALAECRDSEHGFHSGRLHAAAAIRGS